MRIIIGGSRNFNSYSYARERLDKIFASFEEEEIIIVSGACSGADKLGEDYASEHNLKVEKYPADWTLGRRAGPIRNKQMVDIADAVVAFSSGGAGTKSLISFAEKKGIPTFIYDVSEHC